MSDANLCNHYIKLFVHKKVPEPYEIPTITPTVRYSAYSRKSRHQYRVSAAQLVQFGSVLENEFYR
jgi:hypothetical protein